MRPKLEATPMPVVRMEVGYSSVVKAYIAADTPLTNRETQKPKSMTVAGVLAPDIRKAETPVMNIQATIVHLRSSFSQIHAAAVPGGGEALVDGVLEDLQGLDGDV